MMNAGYLPFIEVKDEGAKQEHYFEEVYLPEDVRNIQIWLFRLVVFDHGQDTVYQEA